MSYITSKVTETNYYEIFKDLSLRYKIPLPIIEKICMSQFGLLRDTMKSGVRYDVESLKNVRILGLGLFYFSPGLIKRYKKLNDETTVDSVK